ncbi:MAG: PAS domain S-box protein, partial [Planctomycetota bacterium]
IAFAHSHGILHRDLKSANVVVGEFGQVTLLDWGLAKRMEDADLEFSRSPLPVGKSAETQVGVRLGTPSFMAPEQASGRPDLVDERTDVWGLSAMLYEILTGQPPFDQGSPEATMESVIDDPLIAPSAIRTEVPMSLSRLCERGLSKSQDSRPSTARELLQEVEQWMDKEAERRMSELARQRLFDLSDDLMFVYDMHSRILWGNAAWLRKLGWPPQERVGEPAETLVHPEDRASQDLRERILGGETVSGHENRILSSDGSYRWYSWSMTPILDEGIVCAVGRDIEVLRKLQDEYRALLDAAPDATVVIDENRVILMANVQLRGLFGYEESELLGQKIEILMPMRFRSSHPAMVGRFFSELNERPIDARSGLLGLRKDGTEFPVAIKLSPVHISGEMRAVAAIRAE